MKAVLVVDIPDDIAVEELTAYVEMFSTIPAHYKELRYDSVGVRPLPKRKLVLEHIKNGSVLNAKATYEADGWNDCIDELLGNTEQECPCEFESDYQCSSCPEILGDTE